MTLFASLTHGHRYYEPDMGKALHKAIPGIPYWIERTVDGLFQDGDMQKLRAKLFVTMGLSEYNSKSYPYGKFTSWKQELSVAKLVAYRLMDDPLLAKQLKAEEVADTARDRAENRAAEVGPLVVAAAVVGGIAGGIIGKAVAGKQAEAAQSAADAQAKLEANLSEIQEAEAAAAAAGAAPAGGLSRGRLLALAAVAVVVILVARAG